MSRITEWDPEPDIYGYRAALLAADGALLLEAALTVREDGSAAFDIFGQDGCTKIAQGEADTVEEAMAAAEEGMRLH